jgi:hypothetical protein
MSVICDLQLDVVGVGFLLAFDFRGPPAELVLLKAISPLFPFDLSIATLCPCKCLRSSATGNLPLTWANIASLNFDTINFLHKVGFKLRFPNHVA